MLRRLKVCWLRWSSASISFLPLPETGASSHFHVSRSPFINRCSRNWRPVNQLCEFGIHCCSLLEALQARANTRKRGRGNHWQLSQPSSMLQEAGRSGNGSLKSSSSSLIVIGSVIIDVFFRRGVQRGSGKCFYLPLRCLLWYRRRCVLS